MTPEGTMVYVIRAEGTDAVKIGLASDPIARMKQLQIGTPHRLKIIREIAGDRRDEKSFHRHFKKFRQFGEWFLFHEDMLTYCPNLHRDRAPYTPARGKTLEDRYDSLTGYKAALVKRMRMAGYSQKRLSLACGYQDSFVSQLLRDQRIQGTNVLKMVDLCAVLGCSLDEILAEELAAAHRRLKTKEFLLKKYEHQTRFEENVCPDLFYFDTSLQKDPIHT